MEISLHAAGWFEIPVTDFERAKKFYATIYDYDMPEMQMGSNRMGIRFVDQSKGGVGGATVQGEGYVPTTQGALVYLNGGTDLNTVPNRVEKAGRKILHPKSEITPEYGHFALFVDTEGRSFHEITPTFPYAISGEVILSERDD
jgi:predicted enzyme related to lactoylglutathione lyase